MPKDTLKFIIAVFLSCVALTFIAVAAVRCGEIAGDTVTEDLMIVVPFGLLGLTIIVILLVAAACDERDHARHRNQLPTRRNR